ncbi:hypothetical protein ABZ387_01530 [Streptomyces flaveolus]|uniref:hypothetical protein n=1 Tax=Streptomyces flaveolus TaxID=67297 RepID=UPI00340BBAB9
METETKATLAAALATGYVLGRTKKGKLAIGAASVLAGQGLLSPRELIIRGLRKASESPQAAQLLTQLRGELMDSARSALSATADRRLGALADSLEQRTSSLVKKPGDEDEEQSEDSEPDEGPDDQEPDDEEPDDEEEEAPPPRRRAKKAPASRPAGKKAAAGEASPQSSRRR